MLDQIITRSTAIISHKI